MFSTRRIILFLFSIGTTGMVMAQQRTNANAWQFHSINNVELLEGQTGSSFQLQSINGMQYKTWYTGIGLGLDFYRYRTIPLFLDIRNEFGKGKNKFFVYADPGINFCWLTDNEKTMYVSDDEYHPGLYMDIGMGYKMNLGGNNHLLLAIGYSQKKLRETYQIYDYNNPPFDPADKQTINYSLNRLALKIGWEF